MKLRLNNSFASLVDGQIAQAAERGERREVGHGEWWLGARLQPEAIECAPLRVTLLARPFACEAHVVIVGGGS